MRPLESVPNVSEGRDPAAVGRIADAYRNGGARVLDTHSDPDHHRTVHTLVASSDEALVEALLAGIAETRDSIDLNRHDGIHPRVGAADVVPLVPLEPVDMPRARAAANELARRVGDELGLPVFLYGEVGEGRRPAFFRRGGPAELQARIDRGELAPAFGPMTLDPRSGAVLVGARAPLAAFNLALDTEDVALARSIAGAVRASGGGMAGVQAIGVPLATVGRAQVSMNVIDLDAAPLHTVVARVRAEARALGVEIVGGELVGLLLARVVRAAADVAGELDVTAEGLPGPNSRGAAAASFALPELALDRIVEYHLER